MRPAFFVLLGVALVVAHFTVVAGPGASIRSFMPFLGPLGVIGILAGIVAWRTRLRPPGIDVIAQRRHGLSSRELYLRGHRFGITRWQTWLGAIAGGALGFAIGVVFNAIDGRRGADAMTWCATSGSIAFWTTLELLARAYGHRVTRHLAGRCLRCDFDLRATALGARCPECGHRAGWSDVTAGLAPDALVLVLLVTALLGVSSTFVLGARGEAAGWLGFLVPAGSGVAAALGGALWLRRVRRASGTLCPHCDHDLRALELPASCTECGRVVADSEAVGARRTARAVVASLAATAIALGLLGLLVGLVYLAVWRSGALY